MRNKTDTCRQNVNNQKETETKTKIDAEIFWKPKPEPIFVSFPSLPEKYKPHRKLHRKNTKIFVRKAKVRSHSALAIF